MYEISESAVDGRTGGAPLFQRQDAEVSVILKHENTKVTAGFEDHGIAGLY